MENNSKNILNSFQVHEELNPDIWFLNNGSYKMKPEIRDSLLAIVEDFSNFVDVNMDIEDITLTGSLSNFNWSSFSDVDLHMLLDFDGDKDSLLKKYLDSRRIIWNSLRDIEVKGFEVEMYVQDMDEPHFASGVYSVMFDEWIVEPKLENVVLDSHKILSKSKQWMEAIDNIEDNLERAEDESLMLAIDEVKKKLKKYRGSGLKDKGEYSYENLSFKFLRRNGYLGKLNDIKNKLIDKSLTLETEVSNT
ncbi:hypothetical protein N9322_01145 [bacterium]|jgi:hypothetical protein|nr:hypothetical protein [bacterium]|tara:strand:- start:11771 stop:12517 length:747 start_codon:yes stop_codon:yes gene_type:complete